MREYKLLKHVLQNKFGVVLRGLRICPVLRDHLSCKTTLSWLNRWSQMIGLKSSDILALTQNLVLSTSSVWPKYQISILMGSVWNKKKIMLPARQVLKLGCPKKSPLALSCATMNISMIFSCLAWKLGSKFKT